MLPELEMAKFLSARKWNCGPGNYLGEKINLPFILSVNPRIKVSIDAKKLIHYRPQSVQFTIAVRPVGGAGSPDDEFATGPIYDVATTTLSYHL